MFRIRFPDDAESITVYAAYDPAAVSDRGPHVDRVGLVAVDTDYVPGPDDDLPPGYAAS
jgi:hypothetical protein